jgi:WD40 repeat protein
MSWEAGEGRVTSVVFLPNGKLLAVACWKSIQLWDVLNGKSVAKLDSHTDKVWCLAVSSDSKILVSVAWDGMMILWDLAQRKELAKLDRSKENDEKFQSVTLRCVALSRDGKMIVTCGTYRFKDGQQVDRVKVWDLTNQRVCVSLDISPP